MHSNLRKNSFLEGSQEGPVCLSGNSNMEMSMNTGEMMTEEERSTRTQTRPSATLSTTYNLGQKQDPRGERQPTKPPQYRDLRNIQLVPRSKHTPSRL